MTLAYESAGFEHATFALQNQSLEPVCHHGIFFTGHKKFAPDRTLFWHPKKSKKAQRATCLRGVVGYHVCLTHRRSPVRIWTKTVAFFSFLKNALQRSTHPSVHPSIRVMCSSLQHAYWQNIKRKRGLIRGLNPGPRTPEARIIPLDQSAFIWICRLYALMLFPCVLHGWNLCWILRLDIKVTLAQLGER